MVTAMSDNTTVAVQVRVSGPLRKQLEEYRKGQDRVPPLSQALRALLEKALAAEQPHQSTEEISA
jgi:hypothetical protein